MENDEVISILNDLIETAKDGQKGFMAAANGLNDASLKTLLTQYSEERANMAGELQQLTRDLGGDPDESGSVSGSVHRGWINIKQAVTGKDTAAIISEAERGEDVAKESFQKALGKDLPADVRPIIERDYAKVKAAHDRVRALEISYQQRKAA